MAVTEIFRKIFDPFGNVGYDLVALVVVEEEVVAFGVIVAGDPDRVGERLDEGLDVAWLGKDVLAAMENKKRKIDLLPRLL